MALNPSKFNSLNDNESKSIKDRVKNRYDEREKVDMPRGSEYQILSNGRQKKVSIKDQPRALFSDYHLFYLKKRDGGNYPLTEDEIGKNSELFKNVKPTDLIDKPKGGLIYKASDFLYLSDLNNVPLNRLITLNRFAYPVFDNISESLEPPVTTMLTFATNEYNKFSEILSMDMGMKWMPKESTIEEISVKGDPSGFKAGDGLTGKFASGLLNTFSPEFGENGVAGENRLNFNPYHDQNKIYGRVDSIQNTHLRDRGLEFEQPISLKFKYEVKSINGISQKAAFIDLLSKIFLMTTNDAKFWGGARYYTGQRPSKMAMNMRALQPRDWSDFLNIAHKGFNEFLGGFSKMFSGGLVSGLKNLASSGQVGNVLNNVLNIGVGKTLDSIGRPSIQYMNSLLTGDPVGIYHLTIGNPMNPIMTIGNLINDGNTKITFGDTLGYEDFPTEIFVEMTLKHAMPRGRADIEAMFNHGTRTYWKPEEIIKSKKRKGKSDFYYVGSYLKTEIDALKNFDSESVFNNKSAWYSFINEKGGAESINLSKKAGKTTKSLLE